MILRTCPCRDKREVYVGPLQTRHPSPFNRASYYIPGTSYQHYQSGKRWPTSKNQLIQYGSPIGSTNRKTGIKKVRTEFTGIKIFGSR